MDYRFTTWTLVINHFWISIYKWFFRFLVKLLNFSRVFNKTVISIFNFLCLFCLKKTTTGYLAQNWFLLTLVNTNISWGTIRYAPLPTFVKKVHTTPRWNYSTIFRIQLEWNQQLKAFLKEVSTQLGILQGERVWRCSD